MDLKHAVDDKSDVGTPLELIMTTGATAEPSSDSKTVERRRAAVTDCSSHHNIPDTLSDTVPDPSDDIPGAVHIFPAGMQDCEPTIAPTASIVPDEIMPPQATELDDAELEAEYTERINQKAVLAEILSPKGTSTKKGMVAATFLLMLICSTKRLGHGMFPV